MTLKLRCYTIASRGNQSRDAIRLSGNNLSEETH